MELKLYRKEPIKQINHYAINTLGRYRSSSETHLEHIGNAEELKKYIIKLNRTPGGNIF